MAKHGDLSGVTVGEIDNEGLVTPRPLQLAVDTPIKIELVEEETERPDGTSWLRWFLLAAAALVFTVAGLWVLYIFPQSHSHLTTCGPEIPELSVALSHPRYVAVGDDGYVDVTLVNEETKPITGTLVLLFSEASVVKTALSEGNTVDFGLTGGGRVTRRLRFSLGEPPSFFRGGVVRFQPWVIVDDGRETNLGEEEISIAPIPYIRTVLSSLAASPIIAGLVKFLWDEVKRRWFPSLGGE